MRQTPLRDARRGVAFPTSASSLDALDVRGVFPAEIDARYAHRLGSAVARQAQRLDSRAVVVSRDGRSSSVELSAALQAGIRAGGVNVIDVGMAPTPLAQFAAVLHDVDVTVAVTGGQLPATYNGFKLAFDGKPADAPTWRQLHDDFESPEDDTRVPGHRTTMNVLQCYLTRVAADIRIERSMKIAVDCGNGVCGAVAAPFFDAIGCETVGLFTEVDGAFPNHLPDPCVPENLQDLVYCLRYSDCELGLAFDGDGSRLGVVTKSGRIVWPDRQLILFARDLLARKPGARIVYDVKSSRNVARDIAAHGGSAHMAASGRSAIRHAMTADDALLGGEMCGHLFFRERWYGFEDAFYAAARLLELVSRVDDASALLDALPQSCATPEIRLPGAEREKRALVARLQAQGTFQGAQSVVALDGLRVDYADGFGLARASRSGIGLVFRFEGDSESALARIQGQFRKQLLNVAPDLELPF
jgi:phosphomannomutase/phosphoglucomutase